MTTAAIDTDRYVDTLERICRETIGPEAAAVDRGALFPIRSIEALRSAGLLGAMSASEVGGLALGLPGAARIVARIAQECGSTAMVVVMHFAGAAVLEQHAGDQARKGAASGQQLTTLAFSEAGSRSHFWAPVGTAKLGAGDAVMLDARKSWVTSASHATNYVWSSRPLEAEGASTLWLVPANLAGMAVEGPFDGLGLRGNDSCPVTATNVRTSRAAMLGADGAGFDVMMQTVLPVFNVLSTACSLGFMEAAVQRTSEHASGTHHTDTNESLAQLPTIRNYIARMRSKTDMVSALLEDTLAAMRDGRPDVMLRVLESKAAAGETATEVLDLAMRVCGGAAFRRDVGVERYFRDTRAAGVMAPTTDVLYDFIGKAVCGLPLF